MSCHQDLCSFYLYFNSFLCRMLLPSSVWVTICICICMCMHACLYSFMALFTFAAVFTPIIRGKGERWTHIPPNQCWPSCKWLRFWWICRIVSVRWNSILWLCDYFTLVYHKNKNYIIYYECNLDGYIRRHKC